MIPYTRYQNWLHYRYKRFKLRAQVMTSKDSEEFVFRGSAFTRSVDLVICGTRVLGNLLTDSFLGIPLL